MNDSDGAGHDSAGNRHALLDITDLTFAWRAQDAIQVSVPHFSLDAGERVFISGASGSGKSSLLSLISAVALPRNGSIRILGECITRMGTAERDRFRADHLGIVFQLFNLVPYLSVMENVMLPCRFSRRRRERLAAAGTTPEREARRLLAALELDEQLITKRKAIELSIGQQQRVAVARAFIGSPELIIADEPTSALDEGASERFLKLLLSESQVHGSGVLFVSHDQRLAPHFDRHVRFESLNLALATATATAT